jgi:hypothetical protein
MKKINEYFSIKNSNANKSLLGRILDNKIYRIGLGTLGGGILGFLYWKFIGCNTGSCPLTSNPYQSIILFGAMGAFLAKDKNEKK